MEGAVGPVLEKVRQDHRHQQLDEKRETADEIVQRLESPAAKQSLGRSGHGGRHELHQQVADDEVDQVGLPLEVELGLVATLRQEKLDRDEDRGQDEDVDQQPVEAQGDDALLQIVGGDRACRLGPLGQQDGQGADEHARHREPRLAAEKEAGEREPECE